MPRLLPRAAVIAAVLLAALPLRAEERPQALFAIILGVNRAVDTELEPLSYADDDAARYFDLFRALGARTYLLTSPDGNTSRLHSQAAAEARAPRERELESAVTALADDVRLARRRGVRPVLYAIYAGHGNLKGGQGYLTLEDARLTGERLAELLTDRIAADRTHLIVDACHSYFLAYGRGPGGQRRALAHFSHLGALARDRRVGLLLSTSSARESHEWEAFQAGVFSHEVRSGLYGAADVDADGRVSYREIAAFVEQANAAIPNERYRPRVLARPPRDSGQLLDLRSGLSRRLEIEGDRSAHYLIEDGRGVRLADFHNAPGQALSLVRPAASGRLYLRRVRDRTEFVIPAAPEVVRLDSLEAGEPRSTARGAAHESFERLFDRPFDRDAVASYQFPRLPLSGQEPVRSLRWNEVGGLAAIGLGAAAGLAGGLTTLSAQGLKNQDSPDDPHRQVVRRNDEIDRRNNAAIALYSVAGAAVVGGLVLLLFPERDIDALVGASDDGAVFAVRGAF